jgi:hypothetical protein
MVDNKIIVSKLEDIAGLHRHPLYVREICKNGAIALHRTSSGLNDVMIRNQQLTDKLCRSRQHVKAMVDIFPKNEEFNTLLIEIDSLLGHVK